MKSELNSTTIFHDPDTRPEIFRVGLTSRELDCHTNWPDLRDLLMKKGIPLYKLVDGANFRQIQVRDGVILEFE